MAKISNFKVGQWYGPLDIYRSSDRPRVMMHIGPDKIYSPISRPDAVTDMFFVSADGEEPSIHFRNIVENAFRINESDLRKAGAFLVAARQEATLAGVDVHGEPFAPYSPSYIIKKGDDLVNLMSRGMGRHMVNALDYRVFANVGGSGSHQAIQFGIYGDMELVGRARIHDQGAIVHTRNYYRMLPSGRMPKRKVTSRDTRAYKGTRKLVTSIPQREWLKPTPEEIDQARQIIIESMMSRLSFGDSPGHREPIGNVSPTTPEPTGGTRREVKFSPGFNRY